MRRVIGKRVVALPDDEFAALRARYRAVLLDVGTGDGKHAAHLARQRPDWLIVGLDANRDNMARTAQRAAANPARGGLANLVFVWAAVEHLPDALTDIAEIHALMPWGSLLHGLLGRDTHILANLAAAAAPGATLLVTLNLRAWRTPVPEVADTPQPTPTWARETLKQSYAQTGWRLHSAHYCDAKEIAALATSWSRRLGAAADQQEVLALTATRTHTTPAHPAPATPHPS